jgi:predicted nucleotidyltransferase
VKLVDDTKIPDIPYPELRGVLHTFVDEIAAELKENIVGIYLVGSIASGDFDLDSDVDFLVLTYSELSESNKNSLQDIHKKIHDIDNYPAKHLEGSYIWIDDLNNWSSVGEKEFVYFDNGSTRYELSTHDNQWHVRWILRERGITLLGEKPETWLPSIPSADLSKEIKKIMLEIMQIFRDEINHPLNFWNSRFGQSFTVLTYCRMLHTLHTGSVESKRAGVEWAKQFVEPKWIHIIDQAWNERKGVRFGVKIGQRAELTLLGETLEFIQYALTKMDGMKKESQ